MNISVEKRFLSLFLAFVMVFLLLPWSTVEVHASSLSNVSLLQGKLTLSSTPSQYNSADRGTATDNTDGTYTFTATGYDDCGAKPATHTITITNTSSTASVKFKFLYSLTANSGNCFFDNDKSNAITTDCSNVTKEHELAVGGSLTIQITSDSADDSTTTLVLSGFELLTDDAFKVTVEYDEDCGSVTKDDSTIASGTALDVVSSVGASLTASPQKGYTFFGWYDESDTFISADLTYNVTPTSDMTVKARFASSSAPKFGVGVSTTLEYFDGVSIPIFGDLGTRITYYKVTVERSFDNLDDATVFAENTSYKNIVLLDDVTLTGKHIIPRGVTLLVPFDANYNLYKDQIVSTGTYETPSAFRTLTLADGATLIVNGELSISAKQYYANGPKAFGGCPTGKVGFIQMHDNSSITVNKDGKLYAYGFVTGSGTVTANSGAHIYEMFQIMDFRGGSISTAMINGMFPLSQYYIQNVEVAMTLYAGATEHACTTIYMSSAAFYSDVAFIAGSGAMFNLTSGYVTKRYDGATDRLIIDAYGNVALSSINMAVGTGSINSKDFELPINGNITLNVCGTSSLTIKQDVAILPGGQFLVEEQASIALGKGYNIYIYDADQWGDYCFANSYIYPELEKLGYSGANVKFKPVIYAPGRTHSRTEAEAMKDVMITLDGTFDASVGYVYTTLGGGNITSNGGGRVVVGVLGTQTVTYQGTQGSEMAYVEIPINPVWLKNEDGSYTQTGNKNAAGTYIYETDRWVCYDIDYTKYDHTYTSAVTTEPTCQATGVKTYTCSVCGHSYTEELAIVACDLSAITNNGDGTHTVACKYGCGKQETSDHNYSEVVTAPTCTKAGFTTHTCSVCGDTYKTDEVAANGHDWSVSYEWKQVEGKWTCTATHTCANSEACTETANAEITSEVAKEATCTEAGDTKYTATFEESWAEAQNKTVEGDIPAKDHNWSVSYEWKQVEGKWTCTATHTCANSEACTETANAEITSEVAKEATCTEAGDTKYTATFEESWAEAQNKTVEGDIPAKDHNWSVSYEWKQVEGKWTCTATHTCANSEACTETANAEITSEVAKEATCTEAGDTKYTATFEESWAEAQNKTVEGDIPATAHKNKTHHAELAATCVKEGTIEYWSCPDCGKNFSDEACETEVTELKIAIDSTNHVNKSEHTLQDVTCLEVGYTAGTYCEDCKTWISGHEEIPAIGHKNKVHHAKVDATCVEEGTIEYWACPDCGKNFSDEACETEATELKTEKNPDNHELKTTEAKAPTCTEIGWDAYVTCSRCSYSTYVEKDALGHTEGKIQFRWTVVNPVGTAYWDCETCGERFDLETVTTSETTAGDCQTRAQTVYTATAIYKEQTYTSTYIKTGDYGAHTHKAYGYDENGHWSICQLCSQQFDETVHNIVDNKCICGLENVAVQCPDAVAYTVFEQTITVQHAVACKAGYLVNGKYVEITATGDQDSGYSFTAPDEAESVVVVIIGDTDGDGDLDMDDKEALEALLAGAEATDLQLFTADINGNGVVNSADRILLAQALLSKDHRFYKPIAWNTGDEV